jgi:soluble lytic murein transglycosylase-like protein
MKLKTKFVVDAIFLIVLALVIGGLIIGYRLDSADTPTEATSKATMAETTEYITEPTEAELPTEAATEPVVALYDVPLDKELQLHIIETAEAHGIDPAIIIAMARKESNYRANAMGDGGNSYGLLQVQLKWHRKRMQKLGCTDLLDPYQNVTVAVDYLAEQIDRYGGSLEKGLTAYNRGHYAGKVTKYATSVIAMAERLAVTA